VQTKVESSSTSTTTKQQINSIRYKQSTSNPKVAPNGKELLKNINLGMYLGAKIGILGANGAGKSTLMKILAGEKFTVVMVENFTVVTG